MKRLLCALLAAVMLALLAPAIAEEAQIGYVNTETTVYMSSSEKAVAQGTAALGTQVRIEEELLDGGVGWYRVTFLADSSTGWLKADDVDLVIPKRAITATPAPAPAGVTTVTDESRFPVLKASGQVDPDTLPGAPRESMYTLIETGDTGAGVQAVRERLKALGYLKSVGSGKFGKNDASAIKAFQKANGLEQDGVCSPALQAKLFSLNALTKKGETAAAADGIAVTKASVSTTNRGGGELRFTLKNNTGAKVDAFDFSLRLYNTYGERFLIGSMAADATLVEELGVFSNISEERATIGKNATASFRLRMSDTYYFAGCMIAISAYHTEDGDTVRLADDELHWYGFGKGVETGYQPTAATPLTDAEKRLAEGWDWGVTGSYVDAETAKAYNVREGLLVLTLEEGSPMDRAGLAVGDVLLAIGETRILGQVTLERARAAMEPGEIATVLFLHNGVLCQTQVDAPGGATDL